MTNKIDFLINEGEAMGYVYIGIKTKDSHDGMSKISGATKLFAPPEMHHQMTKDIPLTNGLFNGMYNKIVVLHDPTIPPHPVKETPSAKLSNQDKGKVKGLYNGGSSANDIAKELALDFNLVAEYIEDKLSK